MVSIRQPKALVGIPRSFRPRSAPLLAGALLLLLLAPALAEAQQTLCMRMGDMIQCDIPAPPPVQQPGRDWGDSIGDFGASYRRGQESAARTEWLRQQTELLRRQNEQLRQQSQPPAPPQPTERVAAPAASRDEYCSERQERVLDHEGVWRWRLIDRRGLPTDGGRP